MAKPDEETEDADLGEKTNSEEEEDTDEEEEEADDKSGDESSEEDDEESEDDESDEDDSDDEDDKPVTMGALKKLLATRSKNRTAAAARTSGKRDLTNARQSQKDTARLDSLEQAQRELMRNEEKRQFGHVNNLAPDEVDVVYRLVKKPRTKDLSDPIVKGALDGYRQSKRVRFNTPSSGGRPQRVAAREDKNLTPEDRKARFTDRRQEILAGKRGK